MDEGDPRPGEIAWLPADDSYPEGAPTWVSSGDLQPVEDDETRRDAVPRRKISTPGKSPHHPNPKGPTCR